MERLRKSLPKSLEHATSRVKDQGKEAIDFLGMGLMHSRTSSEASSPPARTESPHSIDSPSDDDGPSNSGSPPIIKVESPKKGLRQRLFGKRHSSNASDAEEGRADPDMLSPQAAARSQPVPIVATSSNDDSLSRSISNRNPAIRFAPDIAPSSDTAPGISNYGSSAPGFKRNPNLSMFRSSSVQSTDDAESNVSFDEPDKPRR